MKITNDQPMGRASSSLYHDLFVKLTPESNCIVFEDKRTMDKTSQALADWAYKYIGVRANVKTTSSHPTDGKPRCWLIWPAEHVPPRTAIRGNWPTGKVAK